MLTECKDEVAEAFVVIVKLDRELKQFDDIAHRVALECDGDPSALSARLRHHVDYIAARVSEAHAALGGGRPASTSALN